MVTSQKRTRKHRSDDSPTPSHEDADPNKRARTDLQPDNEPTTPSSATAEHGTRDSSRPLSPEHDNPAGTSEPVRECSPKLGYPESGDPQAHLSQATDAAQRIVQPTAALEPGRAASPNATQRPAAGSAPGSGQSLVTGQGTGNPSGHDPAPAVPVVAGQGTGNLSGHAPAPAVPETEDDDASDHRMVYAAAFDESIRPWMSAFVLKWCKGSRTYSSPATSEYAVAQLPALAHLHWGKYAENSELLCFKQRPIVIWLVAELVRANSSKDNLILEQGSVGLRPYVKEDYVQSKQLLVAFAPAGQASVATGATGEADFLWANFFQNTGPNRSLRPFSRVFDASSGVEPPNKSLPLLFDDLRPTGDVVVAKLKVRRFGKKTSPTNWISWRTQFQLDGIHRLLEVSNAVIAASAPAPAPLILD